MKIIGIVQARMCSQRLPGKVMKDVLGRPLIGYLLERLSQSKVITKLVLATSLDASNDPLCEYVSSQGIEIFRGSEEDVLDRFYSVASAESADLIIRVTADSPLVDYKHVDKVVQYLIDNKFDYVSSGAVPPVFPDGLDTEVFNFRALEKAWVRATRKSDREHVTAYIRREPSLFIGNYSACRDYSRDRFTLDNQEDFEVIKNIIEGLYVSGGYFDTVDILAYKSKYPERCKLNQHILRNEGYIKSLDEENRENVKSIY